MKAIHVAFGLLAAVAATSGQCGDKVYKWKDANGIVHFSDAPPPKGTEFNNVRIVGQSAAITQDAAATPPPEAGADPAKPATADNSKEARCKSAQQRAALLSSSQQLTHQRDGKLVPMTPEDRAAELAIAKATVTSLCPAEATN